MTREEKEQTGKYVLQMARLLEDGCYQQEKLLNAVHIIDEALEQQPCDDCISRQAVIEMAYDMSEIDGEHFTEPCMVVNVEDIQKLSPVAPAEKVGRWVYNKNLSTYYGDVYTCSECGERCLESCYDHIDKLPNFCPKCHTKMEVVDET